MTYLAKRLQEGQPQRHEVRAQGEGLFISGRVRPLFRSSGRLSQGRSTPGFGERTEGARFRAPVCYVNVLKGHFHANRGE
jgi:hypothetical protein